MASDPSLAKLFAHIAACHTARLPGARLAFRIGDHVAGYVQPEFAALVTAASQAMTISHGQLVLAAESSGQLNEIAKSAGISFRNEDFDVRETVDGPVVAVLDRGALPDFGVIGVGVHVNGLVKKAAGWHLWIGKRAANKKLDPSKLDHLVAGGVSTGMTAMETLLKEGEEEAGVPEALMRNARPVVRLDYNMERPEGLRRDVVFGYDLELPEDFVPSPNDGEVEHFELWPLQRVFETAKTTDEFKFNVNLVLIDLFVRFGLVTGKDATALRNALQGQSTES